MSVSTVISVENLGKVYRISHQSVRPSYGSMRDVVAQKVTGLFRRKKKPSAVSSEDFWALKGVSFEIKQSHVYGIIGRNGAGKSTLLKVLSRITEPSEGRVRLRGRVASLLEVGTGFHGELTGRENIFLNGAILGMSRAEIRRKFDEIVAFAQVEQFLDTPVKHYSSGMFVRLAFAVASHLEPEILIVDEVLAVGDVQFQAKCLGKMQDVVRNQGRTVLFVSHNFSAVKTLCSHALLLANGKLLEEGETTSVVESYLSQDNGRADLSWKRPASSEAKPAVYFRSIEAFLHGKQPAMTLTIRAELCCRDSSAPKCFVSADLCDALGSPVFQAIPVGEPFMELREGLYEVSIEIDLPPLIPGRYTADLWIGPHYHETIDFPKNTVAIIIDQSPVPDRTYPHSSDHGSLVPTSRCEVKRL